MHSRSPPSPLYSLSRVGAHGICGRSLSASLFSPLPISLSTEQLNHAIYSMQHTVVHILVHASSQYNKLYNSSMIATAKGLNTIVHYYALYTLHTPKRACVVRGGRRTQGSVATTGLCIYAHIVQLVIHHHGNQLGCTAAPALLGSVGTQWRRRRKPLDRVLMSVPNALYSQSVAVQPLAAAMYGWNCHQSLVTAICCNSLQRASGVMCLCTLLTHSGAT